LEQEVLRSFLNTDCCFLKQFKFEQLFTVIKRLYACLTLCLIRFVSLEMLLASCHVGLQINIGKSAHHVWVMVMVFNATFKNISVDGTYPWSFVTSISCNGNVYVRLNSYLILSSVRLYSIVSSFTFRIHKNNTTGGHIWSRKS
jgi:hypothetical protein